MFSTQIDEAHWAVRILEAYDECEVCGQAPEYGKAHCRRCRKLTEAANNGSHLASLALQARMAMAAD